jgi:hypothetical protein
LVIPLALYESYLDAQGWWRKVGAWVRGLRQRGLRGARLAAAGLTVA